MEAGRIVEYIDRQKITCAIVLEVKNQKLRLLTETGREVKLAPHRLVHRGKDPTDVSVGRQKMTDTLKIIVGRRNALIRQIDIKELWEAVNTEEEWIDLPTMTSLCFPDHPGANHESAVIRAIFGNRLYFKFDHDRFFPHTEEQVDALVEQMEEDARKAEIIENGGRWLRSIIDGQAPESSEDTMAYARILRSLYLFGDDEDSALGKGMLSKAGVTDIERVFQVLAAVGIFEKDENIDLLRSGVSTDFPDEILTHADQLVSTADIEHRETGRKDFTCLPIMTIDGPRTLDYDDALSVETRGGNHFVGVHIIDVGHFVGKGHPIDQEAMGRASSIYMPDYRIPMLPPQLAEGLCSLKADKVRPAISIMMKLNQMADVVDYEIVPSYIRVKQQLTYYGVNLMADEDGDILTLRDIAKQLRRQRLDRGAVQISLPEINVMLDEDGAIDVKVGNRESPARVLVEELMILANGLMARFLADRNIPAVFRTQLDPKQRLYKGEDGTLYQNYSQRRLLSRFILSTKPERHSGLGVDAYVTATSPIRRYFDLVTQRQIRAALGMETPYTSDELRHLMQVLQEPMRTVQELQHKRKRYWLLRYLETQIGTRHQAIVVYKRRNSYQILIPAYMLECTLPFSIGLDLKPEDLIHVKLQHVNARQDSVSVFWEQ